MEHSPAFSFPRKDKERDRLDQLAAMIAGVVLGNTQREMLRKLAETGEPIDLIVRGLLAYGDEARYTLGRLDVEDDSQLAKAKALAREIKQIEWTVSLFERVLSPLPESKKETTQ